jgi:SAM-dependent methyltransferase
LFSFPLTCTVRRCGLTLARRDRALVCPAGHSYDVARSGYVNLLQPQDRRSRQAGDAKSIVDARARLFAAGVGRAALDELVERAERLGLDAHAGVADLGSGAGDLLGTLAARLAIGGVGIDLSPAAAEHAARRYPELAWIVANADRRLPFLDASARLLLSLHGRRNPSECARVLATDGHLLIAVPAPDDLVELRTLVSGQPPAREQGRSLLDEHQDHFRLVERTVVRERLHVERAVLLDLLRVTYRGERRSAGPRVDTLTSLDVTMASEMFLLQRG